MRFESIRNEYYEMKRLKDSIAAMNKKKAIFHDLPVGLHPYFLKEAKRQRKKDYNETDAEVDWIKEAVLIDEYASDINRSRPLVAKALQAASQDVDTYFSTKEDLAYLGYFRKRIRYDSHTIHKGKKTYKKQQKYQRKHPEELQ
jgi:hypothetical protein